MRRLLIAGAGTGAHWNAGDAAILASMVRQFRDLSPESEIQVVSANPPGSLASWGVTEVRYDNIPVLVSAAQASDFLILGGGGLFFDYWGFPADQILTPGHAGLSFYIGFALLATLFKRPLMIYGVGVGPLRSDAGRRFTKVAFEQADVITVRDADSKSLLMELGIPPERIMTTGDPAFVLVPANARRVDDILNTELGTSKPDRPLIAVAIREWAVGTDPRVWESELARSLDRFVERHHGTLIFLPFHKSIGDVSDHAVAQRVRAGMRRSDRAFVFSSDHTPEEISGIISRCDAVVGMRLHSIIFARTHAVPMVAIGYDPKVQNALSADLMRYSLPLSELSADRLDALLEEMWSQRDAIKKQMTSDQSSLAAAAAANVTGLRTLVEKGRIEAKPVSAETAALLAETVVRQLKRVAELEQVIARAGGEAAERQEAIDWLQTEIRVRDAEIGTLRGGR